MKNYDVAGGMHDPFWKDLPFTNIHDSLTPDALHQLYQGVMAHLINWVQEMMSKEELDRRIRCLPPTYGVRHFRIGISTLKQTSGPERKNIGKILLACLAPDIPPKAVRACRAILDFIYMALYGSHDEETLKYMEDALDEWYKNRDDFLEARVREDFNIPKFHSLLHYVDSIRKFGTTDNYNTELFERLHIDFAKQGWRASNKRNHFPQMIQWLSRQEKVLSFSSYQSWLQQETESMVIDDAREKRSLYQYSIAKFPAEPHKSITRIMISHTAPNFLPCLKLFLNSLLTTPQSRSRALDADLPIKALDVWHQFKLKPDSQVDGEVVEEIIKAIPFHKKSASARFDNVVVLYSDKAESTSLQGKCFYYSIVNLG
ncbi:hypothetical protein K435DRAFT_660005 [Dendrothele bispora CBS 962.96]|uniref:Uncharacterized protein n=1 Tax=Dendrothele bispora (strain CBS 962.96) TaxID=1314807 RepID=A0A4S8M917_DENBC|nr:hypothetical protein K435DRAFT_660005 [Dendrothele bispora CBS 962.96]